MEQQYLCIYVLQSSNLNLALEKCPTLSNRDISSCKKTSEFLTPIKLRLKICFTGGSITIQEEKGLGACGAGCIIYNHGLSSDPHGIS